MANVTIYYNNISLNQTIKIVYDDVTHTVVSGIVDTYDPAYDFQYAGALIWLDSVSGTDYEVRVQNSSPYAYVVAVANSCAVAITSTVVVKASLPSASDGIITINYTGNQPVFYFRLIGGPNSLDITQTGNNVFTGLRAGTYQVQVTTLNFLTGISCVTALQNVVVGYNAIVCDLVLGTVNTTAAPGATLTVVDYTSSINEPVEYRIDAGAWQNSNVFTGLSAGSKNVQIRYKNFTACASNRNVAVSGVACTIIVASIIIAGEQTKFGKNAALTIVAQGQSGAVTYQIIGPSGTISNSTGIFTNLKPGTYEITLTDAAGCVAVASALLPLFKVPYFQFPRANSHRLVLLSGPFSGNYQDFDNVLLAQMRFPFEKETCQYFQKLQRQDVTKLQWRSNYNTHTAEIRKQSDNSLIASLLPVLKSSLTNNQFAKDGTITTGVAGFTQVYFSDGLPDLYQVGMDITLTGVGAMNGTYEIKDILPGILLASGFQVLLLQLTYSLVPTTSAVSTSAIYNIEEWEVWELAVNWNLYADGQYYIKIIGTDPQFQSVIGQTEPVDLAIAQDDTVLMTYWNADNAFLIDYSTGIKMMLRINARLSLPKHGGQITGMEDSTRRYIKLQENVTRLHDFEVWDTPFYLMEKLQLALAHDNLYVNDLRYASEEKMEETEFEMEVLMNGRARLRQIEFDNENKTDTENGSTMNILSIDNVVIDCGAHNASTGLYPSVGGTGFGGAVKRGNWFLVTVASAPDVNGDVKFPVGCTLQALVDSPGQTDSNWKKIVA